SRRSPSACATRSSASAASSSTSRSWWPGRARG
ncbi:MAG: hypothetical protein AVDCRST_MAG88-3477, partial [uncultured Thermomicrobiales bacterium]